jgi:hypothetical protein
MGRFKKGCRNTTTNFGNGRIDIDFLLIATATIFRNYSLHISTRWLLRTFSRNHMHLEEALISAIQQCEIDYNNE